jgi:hypothetical protein
LDADISYQARFDYAATAMEREPGFEDRRQFQSRSGFVAVPLKRSYGSLDSCARGRARRFGYTFRATSNTSNGAGF